MRCEVVWDSVECQNKFGRGWLWSCVFVYGLLIGSCLWLGRWSLDCISLFFEFLGDLIKQKTCLNMSNKYLKGKIPSTSQLNAKPLPPIFQTITGPQLFWDSDVVQKPANLTGLTKPPERALYVGLYRLWEALVSHFLNPTWFGWVMGISITLPNLTCVQP